MHPSSRIRFARGDYLKNRKIALAVTGSIAAVETVKIARELIRYGADVYPYMTREAEKFISRDALLFATGHEPVVELSGRDEHLEEFDLVLVAPATADIIGKAACGIASDAVSTLILANLSRCLFVPAMSERMFSNPVFRENLEKVSKFAKIMDPKFEEGEMKIPSREEIAARVVHELHDDLRGKKILVIGGAGYEKIDDFRIVTNLSTGCTSIAIAKVAYFLGADVKLLLGLHSCDVPSYIPVKRFTTLEDLMGRIEEISSGRYDAILVPAALPDFKPSRREGKVGIEEMRKISWEENPKFLSELRKKYDGLLVGFKAESNVPEEELISRARDRMKRHRLDLIVANDLAKVSRGETEALIISAKDIIKVRGTKEGLARKIMGVVADAL